MSAILRIRRSPKAALTKPTRSGRSSCHVLPRPPVISLDCPGRLRTAHVLAIFGISHSTLYAKMKSKTFPRPDGKDGMVFWNTETIRALL